MNTGTINEHTKNILMASDIPDEMASILAILLSEKSKTAMELRQMTGLGYNAFYDVLSDLRTLGYVNDFHILIGERGHPTKVYFLSSTKDVFLIHLCKQVSNSRYLENDDQMFELIFYLLSKQENMVNKRSAIDDVSMKNKHVKRILNKMKKRGWVEEFIPLTYPISNESFLRLNISIDELNEYYRTETERR
jgi:ribosomal protein S8